KTLCFLNYALMIRQDYDITSSLRRGALQAKSRTYMLREPIKIPQPQVVTSNEFTNYMKANDAILKNMQTNMTSLTNSNLELINMFGQFMKINIASSSGSRTLPSNTITNPKEDLKGITTRSGTAYQGPMIPNTSSSLPPVVERETEVTKDTVHPTNNESTKDVQPLVVQTESLILNFKPVVSPIIKPVVAHKLRDKANDQKEKLFQMFKDLNFNISFADALILMPKFGPTIKTLLTNKDKMSKLARTSLNEHCSAVLLKKLPEKLGDLGKSLIPCDFSGMAECLALVDLGASINLMPLSVWNKLSLPNLFPTCMTLELADYSISRPVGVVEDVFVKVGTFRFPADFVVADFDADPRVPLILERSFLKAKRALIDVFEGEVTLRVGKGAITFNLDQTSRYSANYNDVTANRIDVIDMACEKYSQEVLGFLHVITSSIPTPYHDPIVSTSSQTLTSFGESDFLLEEVNTFIALEDDATSLEVDQSYELKIYEAKSDKSSIDEPPEVQLKDLPPHLEYAFLEGDAKFPVIIEKDLSVEEKIALIMVLKSHKRSIAWKLSDIKEVDAFLALEDDPTSPKVNQSYLDSEGDILLLEAFLNDDPSLPPLNQGNYLPEVRKELKICEAKSDKSSIDEPPEVELKDLPSHLEYAFLEGDDKLPVIILKDLSVEEKTALITVLKSYKRAIA
nr:reverse transcriptase domain-containing protein [Tanacetum cinerariifolium]